MQSVHANCAGSVWETQRGEDWRDRAACVGENPELWFSYSDAELYVARTICGGCPVKAECQEFAAEVDRQHGKHGIWAGLDETQRTRMKRRSPVECGSVAGFKRHRRMKTVACQPCLDAKAAASREEYAKAKERVAS